MFRLTRVSTLAAALITLVAAAPAVARPRYPYTLIDPGTFGGPQSFLELPAIPLTNQGTLLGQADTRALDSDCPCSDPYIQHALEWRDGRLIDLGALPGENSSAIFEQNDHGVGVGFSENGLTDPFTGNAEQVAVLFDHGKVIPLGALPGGHESFASDVNNQGQVAGFSSNGVPDPFSFLGWGTETRAFIWQHGDMADLGTLGGADTVVALMNERGQITGQSYTNSTPNAATGVPTTDPYLWENGHMRDLGTLGGTFGVPNWMNEHGEVVGQSDITGDQSPHPFLWDGRQMRDLGTLGGDYGAANWINERGDIVGWATPQGDNTAHALLWKNGTMTDLTGAGSTSCTAAAAINDSDLIVGHTCAEDDALMWEAGKQYDLNALIAPSPLHLIDAEYVNDRGEIVGRGVLPNGDQHIFLLIPNPEVALPLGGAAKADSHQGAFRRMYGGSPKATVVLPYEMGRSTARDVLLAKDTIR